MKEQTPVKGSGPREKKPRNVRVFVSSTFQDMQQERDELIKNIFPQLRKMCAERGVGFTEVDLRWGVTQEQSERGEVLPICLAEIEHCRPYFIGLLGERYGWVPDSIPPELIREMPWLAEHLEKSVTELEILHGVLNNPAMADHAFFYFRDPASPLTVPSDNETSAEKLKKLKTRIKAEGFPVKENYSDPETAGQLAFKDLMDAIDRDYPDQKLTPLDRMRLDHEMFAESRARVYVGRKEYFDTLDKHMREDGAPLVILGESGSGKSALLANWAIKFQKENPKVFFLVHFIGSNADSANWAVMLRRIMGEIKQRDTMTDELPDTPEKLRAEFPNWLSMAAARGRLVLVLDGLNQLEDRDQAPDLVWLPEFVPPEVQLIMSTLPGRPLDELKRRGWPTMEILPLAYEERRELIQKYLHLFTKSLPDDQVDSIASTPQSANPLFVRALLDELRVFGIQKEIPRRIEQYLQARNPKELYELVLARLEDDYGPALVRDAMSLLWAARRGLSESELLDILNIPPLAWSPPHLAMDESLVLRSGLIGFFHEFLRQAVHDRYLNMPDAEKAAHVQIADYFTMRDINDRKVDELPWQLAEAREWKRLKSCFEDLPFFAAAYIKNQFELRAYWQKIEENSTVTCVKVYEKILDNPSEYIEFLFVLSDLFYSKGYIDEALKLRNTQRKYYRSIHDYANLQRILHNQASILFDRGEYDSAMVLHKEQEQICRKLGDRKGLSVSLGAMALILRNLGDLNGSIILLKEQETICRKMQNEDGLSSSLGNQAVNFKDLGELIKAMDLLKEQEGICRRIGDRVGLSASLGNQGTILKNIGDLEGAMILHKEQEKICRQLGDMHMLSISLGNQALLLKARGDLDGAMALHKKEEKIYRKMDNKHGLSLSMGNQALILYSRSDLDGAMALHKEEERICREHGIKDGLQRSFGHQANILADKGDLKTAMALYKEKEQICRQLGLKNSLQSSLGNQALILKELGDLDGAMVLLKDQERICRELMNKYGLSNSLGNQAGILSQRGELQDAIAVYEKQERICREIGRPMEIAISLYNQAAILAGDMKKYKEALPLITEALSIFSRLQSPYVKSAREVLDYIRCTLEVK
ncbi:MAG: DUF4062 domain-containing protein [Candidatus Alcyoniella australis]|nr:DUF4062 domain-containing protein [Candidatus Alcyoniella australis]